MLPIKNFLKKLVTKQPSLPTPSNTIKNSEGRVAVLGTSGKYYCKTAKLNCDCCDGNCGPDDGCNCKSCQALDISLAGFIPNRAGYPCKQGANGKFYCFRGGKFCECCFPQCGPDEGHNCPDCSYMDLQFSSGSRLNADKIKSKKSDRNGKFYCGRKIVKCSCCDGHCGPDDGCNCKACIWLDIQGNPNAKLNKDDVKSVKSNEKYYCARKILTCSCCDGYCGPFKGCNCPACQWLDNNVDECKTIEDVTPVLNSFVGLILGQEASLDIIQSLPGIIHIDIKKASDNAVVNGTIGQLVLYVDELSKITKFTLF